MNHSGQFKHAQLLICEAESVNEQTEPDQEHRGNNLAGSVCARACVSMCPFLICEQESQRKRDGERKR